MQISSVTFSSVQRTQQSYLPVVNTWKQLDALYKQSVTYVQSQTFGLAYPMAEALVLNEFEPNQKTYARAVLLGVSSGRAGLDPFVLRSMWQALGPFINKGLVGSIDIYDSLPSQTLTQQQQIPRYNLQAPTVTKKADTTPVPTEEGMPGWVIPAAIAGVVVLGGVYWYMNKGA
jgi:hypothetical protein